MASTKRDNCTWKRNYADARKFRKKNHNLTVVYVQRLCYQDTKTCFKMHSITAKDGKNMIFGAEDFIYDTTRHRSPQNVEASESSHA